MNARRSIRLLNPEVQLRLSWHVLAVSAVFGIALAWQTSVAFTDLYAMIVSEVPRSFAEEVRAQAKAYLWVSGALVVGYVLAMVATCLVHTHQLVGPIVALRRQARSLIRGHYHRRLELRKGDTPFQAIAEDLNELADLLERGQALPPPARHSSARRVLEINRAVQSGKSPEAAEG